MKVLVACVTNRAGGVDSFRCRVSKVSQQFQGLGELVPLHLNGISEIARARSMLASSILRDLDLFDYVILVDDDHDFVCENFETMIFDLKWQQEHGPSDVPLLGWYRIRSMAGEDARLSVKKSHCGRYWVGGLGFCGMSQDCFRRIHHPLGDDWVCVRENMPLIRGVYRSGPVGNWWTSEDISFCNDSRPQLSVRTMVEHHGYWPTSDCTLLDGSPLTAALALEVNDFSEYRKLPGVPDCGKRNSMKRARRARSR